MLSVLALLCSPNIIWMHKINNHSALHPVKVITQILEKLSHRLHAGPIYFCVLNNLILLLTLSVCVCVNVHMSVDASTGWILSVSQKPRHIWEEELLIEKMPS